MAPKRPPHRSAPLQPAADEASKPSGGLPSGSAADPQAPSAEDIAALMRLAAGARPPHDPDAIDTPGALPLRGFGRIPIRNVQPVVEDGRLPAYAVVDEEFTVSANVFREGHDLVGASVVLTSPRGKRVVTDMTQVEPIGLDIWTARVHAFCEGDWLMHVEAWSHTWGTWHHNAAAKLQAGIDIDLVCAEGRELFDRAADRAQAAGRSAAVEIIGRATEALDPGRPADQLLAEVVENPELARVMVVDSPRDLRTVSRPTPLQVERRRALYGSWYEFFPRSQGAHRNVDGSWVSGTFESSYERLEAAARMGFDVVYLPPIHPIGTAFRKGANNSLEPGPFDPGSPWAIGSAQGGHDAVNPDLGSLEDFDRFVARAGELGLEVALDFALQASPDHPWVTSHPEWFTTRVDGTIAYAENPPKKYQDIYPVNFDNDPEGIYHEVVRLLEFWISHGVHIFRVDNPHTKPVNFWAWLMEQMHRRHPEVIFLAEAFTRPEMMQALAKAGFQQGYSYFVWRTEKWELEQYLTEVSQQTSPFYRPNFFTNTPDINPLYLQDGNPAGFAIRAVLAATMSPSWGMYSGFELCEHEALPGREEYLNSEKYQYRPRDWEAQPNIIELITRLNWIRRDHPALQQLRDVTIHPTDNDQVLCFSKRAGEDVVIVVVGLDPVSGVSAHVDLDLPALGLEPGSTFALHDELTGVDTVWAENDWVELWPAQPARILKLQH
ncbi:Alpha-1,4-glucan:maltose-1-phosphate maltosyltransferase 1 [Acidipropionibacterium jensenii]|uniref:Alpha-1,4-glucan:maltose-1-phosphate maltosyltransferase n=2 Tax=Acidipropionibacterium jensenii TaxID=1749 RepID=A0A3S4VHM6_9ACTN|nr:Alpha-1,4-glucan:maltose-1-phosphate maltosyltransferase 1 [Acidipropionibacterium jensenii]